MKKIIVSFLLILPAIKGNAQQGLLYKSTAFTIHQDSIVQDKYTSTAVSAKELISNYKSPANQFQSTKLSFKFSINGRDNEMPSGLNHHFNLLPGIIAPLIKFSVPLKDHSGETNTFIKPSTNLKIRVDMNFMLKDFKEKGFYATFNADKVYREDFKGLHLVGNALPMVWDFNNLFTVKNFN